MNPEEKNSPPVPQQKMVPLVFNLTNCEDDEEVSSDREKANPLENLPLSNAWFYQPKMTQTRPILPSDNEVPSQMSPFGDDRWDLDLEENRRRKEIHRDYVYNLNYRKPGPLQSTFQENVIPEQQQPDPMVQYPPQVEEVMEVQEPPPQPQCETDQKDFFKYEAPKVSNMKSWSEIKFEAPGPANLFPVLKFPEKRINPDQIYKLTPDGSFVPPVSGVPPPAEPFQLPPKPEFYKYQDIKFEKEKVLHYGVHVPFWQFSSKDNVPS